jgi:hypothetical protein
MTLCFFLAVLAVGLTLNLATGGGDGLATLMMGLLLFLIWWLARQRARRRYTPRRLPTRWP